MTSASSSGYRLVNEFNELKKHERAPVYTKNKVREIRLGGESLGFMF